jgi:hypothetical protein
MDYILDFIGFVGAWLELLGLGGITLIAAVTLLVYWTRRRAGRRYDKQAPGRAEAQIDNWHWTG